MKHFIATAFLAIAAMSQAQAAPAPAKSIIDGQIFVVTKGQNAIKLALVNVVAVSEKDLTALYLEKLGAAGRESNELAAEIEEKKTMVRDLKQATKNTEGYSWLEELQQLSKVCDPMKPMAEWSACIREPAGKAAMEKQKEIRAQHKPELDALTAARNELRALQKHSRTNMELVRTLTRPYQMIAKSIAQAKSDADGKFSLAVPVGQRVAIMAESERAVGDKNESYQWIVLVTPKKGTRIDLTLANDNLLETRCGACFVSPAKLKVFPDLREFPEDIGAVDL